MLKSAFTMIELVFIIVVLGILAGVAVPRLAVTRDDATITKLRADVASIRSGIGLERSKAMMEGNLPAWNAKTATEKLGVRFSNVLQGPVAVGNDRNGWTFNDDGTFTACAGGRCATFRFLNADETINGIEYKRNSFVCVSGDCTLFE